MNLSSWREWNDVFAASMIAGEPQEGKDFIMDAFLSTAPWYLRRSTMLMEYFVIHAREKVCWRPQLVPGLHGEHCFVLCPVANRTVVYNYEDQHGFLQPVTQRNLGDATRGGLLRFNANLSTESVRREAISGINVQPAK